MRFIKLISVFLTITVPFVAYAQQSEKQTPISQTIEGTVIGIDGTKYWRGFKIESGGKEYTFVTEYKAKQGTNPTVVGGRCCDIGTHVGVTYIGSLSRYLLNVTRIVILNASSSSQFMPPEGGVILVPIPRKTVDPAYPVSTPQPMVTPTPKPLPAYANAMTVPKPMANTNVRQLGTTPSSQEGQSILKPNQLITFSLSPGQEKIFVLQMKQGDFADVQWLAREDFNLTFEIHDPEREKIIEKPFDNEASISFVAPGDGDFILVSKLDKASSQPNSGAEIISIQYNNKFKLPAGTKQKDIRKINGYDIKIMLAPGMETDSKNSIVLIEKNRQLKKILKVSGSEVRGFSFSYPDYLNKADTAYMTKASIAKENRIISLVKGTADKTGDGIPDVMISYFSGGAHCCFETHFINLGEAVETVEIISTGDAGFGVIGKNPKGSLVFSTADYAYAYWLTSFATSPAVEVILEFKNGKLRPNFDLMKKPAPTLALLKNKAEFYSHKLNFKPYSGVENYEHSDSEDPFYNRDAYPNNENEKYKGALYRNIVFWGPMLDLIYTGHEDLAWQFLDLVWPPQKQGKALFIRDFKKQLSESPYWQMILEDSRPLATATVQGRSGR